MSSYKYSIKIIVKIVVCCFINSVISPSAIEWCSFRKETSVLYSMVVDLIKYSAPGLFHECPYFQGDYKAIVSFSENGKTDLLKFIFGVTINQLLKVALDNCSGINNIKI